jgi:hypothetical protein
VHPPQGHGREAPDRRGTSCRFLRRDPGWPGPDLAEARIPRHDVSDDPAPLDSLLPHSDIRERFHTTIDAPAELVMEVACNLDLQALPMVHAIFRLRELLMRTGPSGPRRVQGLLAETTGMGWEILVRQPDLVICGAACQPWRGDVTFTPIPAGRFAGFDAPNQVKIVWTLETEALGPARTRFSHETRAAGTDPEARTQFRRYWRWARFGIVAIRLFLLPAVRRAAERRWAVEQRRRLTQR